MRPAGGGPPAALGRRVAPAGAGEPADHDPHARTAVRTAWTGLERGIRAGGRRTLAVWGRAGGGRCVARQAARAWVPARTLDGPPAPSSAGRRGPPWGPTGGSKRRLHAAAGRPDRGRRVGRPRWRADGSWSARAGGPSGPSQAGPSPGLGWRVCRRRPPPPWPRPTRGGTGPAVADAPAPDTARARAARGPGRGPGRTCARGATGAGRGQPQPPGRRQGPWGWSARVAGPGVQHPQAPAAPADSRRVQGTLQARWGGGTADDRGEGLRRTPAQRPHRLGRGADHVHVGDGAARRTPCGPPGRGIRALARRTPAVAAGRVDSRLLATVRTRAPGPAQDRRAPGAHLRARAPMAGAQSSPDPGPVGTALTPTDRRERRQVRAARACASGHEGLAGSGPDVPGRWRQRRVEAPAVPA